MLKDETFNKDPSHTRGVRIIKHSSSLPETQHIKFREELQKEVKVLQTRVFGRRGFSFGSWDYTRDCLIYRPIVRVSVCFLNMLTYGLLRAGPITPLTLFLGFMSAIKLRLNTFKIFRILILNIIKKLTLVPKSSKSNFLFIYQ